MQFCSPLFRQISQRLQSCLSLPSTLLSEACACGSDTTYMYLFSEPGLIFCHHHSFLIFKRPKGVRMWCVFFSSQIAITKLECLSVLLYYIQQTPPNMSVEPCDMIKHDVSFAGCMI